jgi:CBS domain-containing membrane protein
MADLNKSVSDLMSTEVVTLQRNDKLAIADLAMKQRAIRHMPVLDESGKVCGVLSQRDVFRGALLRNLGYGGNLEGKMLDSMVVKEAMVSPVITTTPDTPIQKAASKMIENKIGCLPVIDKDELLGILTEEDFVRWVTGGKCETEGN